ncbi:MAG: hypothetical protein ACMZ64_05910 [Oleiphilus sp.]
MFSSVRILTAICLLGMSIGANAIILELNYEGEITTLNADGAGFSVGDIFSGSLLIDTSIAPVDRDPTSNSSDHYSATDFSHTNFVTGGYAVGDLSFDRVQVEDRDSLGDRFSALDYEINDISDLHGKRTYSMNSVSLNIYSYLFDFIHGEGLDQSFNFNAGDSGSVTMTATFKHQSFTDVDSIRTWANDGRAFGVLSSVSLGEYHSVSSVSEPSSIMLLSISLLFFGLTQRRNS